MNEIRDKENFDIDFEKIKEVRLKYEHIKKFVEIRRYNEEFTKNNSILPLFEVLGLNVHKKEI